MKRIFTLFLLVFCLYSASGEELQYISFGDQNIGSIETKTFTTPFSVPVQIRNISASEGIIISNTYIADGSLHADVSIDCNQNISFRGIIYFGMTAYNTLYFSFPVIVTANLFYNDNYDSYTYNKYGSELISSIKQDLEQKHVTLSYKDARTQMWGLVDNYGGKVQCVYTGREIVTSGIPDVTTTHFNTEHSWPQSLGADNEPPKSDIFHMYPTFETANSERANTRYGYVSSGISWEENGSKLGKNSSGVEVFEPRDINKGNIARGLFYFALKYSNPNQYLNDQYFDLMEWHYFDMPDTTEMNRNNRIESVQKDRNPFIDHPEFIERLNLIGDFVQDQVILPSDTALTIAVGIENTLLFYPSFDSKLEYLNIEGCNFNAVINDSNLYGGYPYAVNIVATGSNCTGKCYVKFVDFDEVFEYTLIETEINAVEDDFSNELISVFPNPSSGNDVIIRINTSNELNDIDLSISNYLGQNINLSENISYKPAQSSFTIPYQSLRAFGNSFILNVKIGNNLYHKNIIIK